MEDNTVIEIENEIPETVDVPAESDKSAQPVSLRDQIKEAAKSAQEDKPENNNAESKARERNPDGKFAKKVADTNPAITPVEKTVAPEGVSPSIRAKWNEISPDIQKAITDREQQFHRELTKQDAERTTGRSFQELVMPYAAQMRAEGAEPLQAVKSLLNTAYVLRSGTPAQKTQLLLETARQFGVNLSQAQQGQPQVHPVIQQLQQKQADLEARLQRESDLKTQQEQAGLNSLVETFAADPKNIHFNAVKGHMIALLNSDLAKDLQDAYDQAVYARPDIRSTILGQQSADLEAKRVAEKKAKAEAAKRASTSIRGAPGMVANKNGQIAHSNLRDSIAASWRQVVDG